MADERYEWLDRDAAEKLLRGEPVEVADEHARTEAARLAATLDNAARNPGYGYDDGELPGEAAAMAAFRKARAESTAAAGTSLGTVRVTRSRRGARPARGVGFARPVRFGIAAAFAGCAIGGVAVAAGSGVLPTFGDDRPTPASSVSAAATPGPLTSPSPSGGEAGAASRPPGATGTTPGLPPVTDSATPRPGDAGGSTPGLPTGDGAATPGGADPSKADLYRRSVEACRDYRSGRIDPDRKRRLEAAAEGAERVERFCDELLGGGAGDGGSPGGENGNEGDDREEGDGDGTGKDGGKNSGGSGGDPDSGSSDGSEGAPQLVPDTPQVSYSVVPDTAVTPWSTGSDSFAGATTRAL
jgi:plasmid stabilization system protein ParE